MNDLTIVFFAFLWFILLKAHFLSITNIPRGKDTKSVFLAYNLLTTVRIAEGVLFAPLLLQRLESAALPSGHEPL